MLIKGGALGMGGRLNKLSGALCRRRCLVTPAITHKEQAIRRL